MASNYAVVINALKNALQELSGTGLIATLSQFREASEGAKIRIGAEEKDLFVTIKLYIEAKAYNSDDEISIRDEIDKLIVGKAWQKHINGLIKKSQVLISAVGEATRVDEGDCVVIRQCVKVQVAAI